MTSERVDVLVIGSGAAGGATVDSKAWSRVAVLLLLLTCALSSAQPAATAQAAWQGQCRLITLSKWMAPWMIRFG